MSRCWIARQCQVHFLQEQRWPTRLESQAQVHIVLLLQDLLTCPRQDLLNLSIAQLQHLLLNLYLQSALLRTTDLSTVLLIASLKVNAFKIIISV